MFVIEGPREIRLALKGGYRIESLYFCPELITTREAEQAIDEAGNAEQIQLTLPVFEKLAYRKSTGGLLAVALMKPQGLEQLQLGKKPLLLICEGVEKPGNLGALLRTADAARLDGLIICDPKADFYNPNVIRSSVGCVFTQPVAAASSEETIAWLRQNKIKIYATALSASVRYDTVDFTRPSALIMGTEATGLKDEWLAASDQNIIIPMRGEIDSMNVSAAAAVVVFEAARQRGFA
ncbi:RNA methyltransferase [Cesiribacter andamanensis]|uniref:tRNA (Guanosine(18)-2'-O)-methyltransferase n=1 Tax=Cesiribacter andamanensis AMV16 TaxID=1279009 RepID=M7NQ74_9BACT|nr:RNA methyltransferase [Cesiribacter andamanensis]EMR00674.1 tRNA (guanosine(18)-2'-O)-methyltransferase [Cesiribacter andamanensis AMV16]